jgi:hypothetical protein
MRFPDARILIFAKAPVPGKVKTRLIPRLGAAGASALYERLLRRVAREVATAGLAGVDCWCAPDSRHAIFAELHVELGFRLREQRGEDLGERMRHAAERTLESAASLVLIGGDCPVLKAEHVARSLHWLERGCDAVLGPAEDGGYVLLGLRRSDPRLFAGLPWGTSEVLEMTRQRLRQLGLEWRELEPLWDLDRVEDLERLERVSGQEQAGLEKP